MKKCFLLGKKALIINFLCMLLFEFSHFIWRAISSALEPRWNKLFHRNLWDEMMEMKNRKCFLSTYVNIFKTDNFWDFLFSKAQCLSVVSGIFVNGNTGFIGKAVDLSKSCLLGKRRGQQLGRVEGGRRERKRQEQEVLRTRKSLLRLKYFQNQELKVFLDWIGPT